MQILKVGQDYLCCLSLTPAKNGLRKERPPARSSQRFPDLFQAKCRRFFDDQAYFSLI